MSDSRQALYGAVYDALMGDAGLSALLAGGKVFDHVPRGAAFPFVSLGDCESRPLDGDDTPAEAHRFEVLVHSRAPGRQEVSDIGSRVAAVLTGGGPLSLAGFRLVSFRLRDTSVAASRDQRAYRARMRFEALTEIA